MPTIELTDEQAEELRDALDARIAYWDEQILANAGMGDALDRQHIRSVLSDILELLEIA
jgi:hypothetical protein